MIYILPNSTSLSFFTQLNKVNAFSEQRWDLNNRLVQPCGYVHMSAIQMVYLAYSYSVQVRKGGY